MKKRYCTPDLEVEAFDVFTVFTLSSGGNGQNPGGGVTDPEADTVEDFYDTRSAGDY